MQPAQPHTDLARLREMWQHFTAFGQLAPEVDALIALSWQRCAPRQNPLLPAQWTYVTDDVLPLALKQHAGLRAIALPIMEDIYQFSEGAGGAVLLLDSTTCLLEMLGHVGMLDRAARLGIRQGVYLDEGHVGTNAFATALIECTPAWVVGAEHFLVCAHPFSTAAAPIFNLEGDPIGVIGLLESAERCGAQSLSVAVGAAKAIENQIQADRFVSEANTRTTELNAIMSAVSEGMLAWTAAGIIADCNPQAGQLLNLSPTEVAGRPLAEYITLPESLAQAVSRGEDLSDIEVSLTVKGEPRDCLVSLRAVRDADHMATVYIATLRRIEQVRRLVHQIVGAQARLTLDDIIGRSAAAQRMRRQALAAADAKACVLLLGESGTSKNVLARAIHNSSRRAGGPFITINCRAIPRDLALNEFLGYEAGAFGTTTAGQQSKFELAHGGTLCLEEIESLPLETQAAVLRVIESGDVIRLGGTRVIPVDVRLIASSTVDLEAAVAAGAFRSDLLFRLRSFVIRTTPLRERPEDIPLLLDRLVQKLGVQVEHSLGLSTEASALLCAYPWPGNIRELEAVMERAALLCDGQPIGADHLPNAVRERRVKLPGKPLTAPVLSLTEAERSAILSAGRATGGNLSEAARVLGIGRTTLWRKMKELSLSLDDFRPN